MALLSAASWLVVECKDVLYRHKLDQKLLLKPIGDIAAVVTLLLKNGDLPHPPTDEQIYHKINELAKGGIT